MFPLFFSSGICTMSLPKTQQWQTITETYWWRPSVPSQRYLSGETRMTALYLSESLKHFFFLKNMPKTKKKFENNNNKKHTLWNPQQKHWLSLYMCVCLYLFSFFLEKNMFAFFLNILRQKSGRYVCVQLLQTLNILFENISHETSLCKYWGYLFTCWLK